MVRQWLWRILLGLAPVVLSLIGCGDSWDGITSRIFADAGQVMPRAGNEQRRAFERGREVLMHRFTPEEGLGPTFNQVSCSGCHERPTMGGSAGHARDFLLIGGHDEDGGFVFFGKNGVQAQLATDAVQRVPSDPRTTLSANRNPTPFFGVGLLAEISDEEILRRSDPQDDDGDGISGRPGAGTGPVGRFGRKAQASTLEQYIRGPLFNHLGITSDPLSDAMRQRLPAWPQRASKGSAALDAVQSLWMSRAYAQRIAPDGPITDDDDVPDPELSEEELFDLVTFVMLLAPLAPDAHPSQAAERGHAVFRELGCAACHVEDLMGPGGLVPAYSDLLLHNMGAALEDGIVMGSAKGDEFRTQPLWGLSPTGPYLHDGRADTLNDAIRAHGGEAASSKNAYGAASPAIRGDVIAFLESLGGRAQRSPGLLPPLTPVPGVGEAGGPRGPLSDQELVRFARGRAVLDRDFGIRAGLGPRFNADSCRSCHSDPAPGGAGPGSVDVTRQAILDEGTSMAPPGGTMAHRHAIDGTRPPIDPQASLFERRQTPSMRGLGLLEEVPDDVILQLDDPDDRDRNGISGRAHMLPDGRIGRLGWKAGVPTLADFNRGAMSDEMGITVPADDSVFGTAEDADEAEDPEISLQELEALNFFATQLAPPARDMTVADANTLSLGELLFDLAQCSSCHRKGLRNRHGEEVAAYTDLLLHDVLDDSYIGVPSGDALAREMRTAPLWGLRDTAPYLHDGSASTVEEAIAAHASEADAARQAYEGFDEEERAALLAFLQSL